MPGPSNRRDGSFEDRTNDHRLLPSCEPTHSISINSSDKAIKGTASRVATTPLAPRFSQFPIQWLIKSPPLQTTARADIRSSVKKILCSYLLHEVSDEARDYVFQAMGRDAPGFLRSKALGNLIPAISMVSLIVGLLGIRLRLDASRASRRQVYKITNTIYMIMYTKVPSRTTGRITTTITGGISSRITHNQAYYATIITINPTFTAYGYFLLRTKIEGAGSETVGAGSKIGEAGSETVGAGSKTARASSKTVGAGSKIKGAGSNSTTGYSGLHKPLSRGSRPRTQVNILCQLGYVENTALVPEHDRSNKAQALPEY
ncbi:hypothetical protein BGX38DRAFT_1266834 [Terfezia claveryi]|nr:hypothetical protein BGX38DRAFT_1266834 [Terfezia claveryi]